MSTCNRLILDTLGPQPTMVRGCYVVPFSCSLTSTHQIYTPKLTLHLQTYDETSTKLGLNIGPPLIQLWLLEVHVCSFHNWTHTLTP
jgi:hypothetical protein